MYAAAVLNVSRYQLKFNQDVEYQKVYRVYDQAAIAFHYQYFAGTPHFYFENMKLLPRRSSQLLTGLMLSSA